MRSNPCDTVQKRPEPEACPRRHRPHLFSASRTTLYILLTVPHFVLSFHTPSFILHFVHRKAEFSSSSLYSESPLNADLQADVSSSSSKSAQYLQLNPQQQQQSPIQTESSTSDADQQGPSDTVSIKPRKKKYQRKREQPPSEKELDLLKQVRQAEYESAVSAGNNNNNSTSLNRNNNNNVLFWDFERLFPEPVWDDATILRDLYEVSDRDKKQRKVMEGNKDLRTFTTTSTTLSSSPRIIQEEGKTRSVSTGSSNNNFMRSLSRAFRPPTAPSNNMPYDPPRELSSSSPTTTYTNLPPPTPLPINNTTTTTTASSTTEKKTRRIVPGINIEEMIASSNNNTAKVDRALTRMVEERLYGYRRTINGDYVYETSLMGDGAVKFRDGKRLGNPLQVNIDLLNYHAKREMKHGRLEEAEELYEEAISVDSKDGRAYLGLSKIAERRRDFAYAKECLRIGIARSVSFLERGTTKNSSKGTTESSRKNGAKSSITGGTTTPGNTNPTINIPDHGANPFLLQALGTLEEQLGHLTEAEALYVEATKSRPSHAAAWVALGELRSKKLRQGPSSGRVCFQAAERELRLAGLPQSAHVYTAWASLEHKAGDIRRARELFQYALDIDPKCSSAWLQLGVLEANKENWIRAKECFETVLKFDQRNSRVLQAYAIMESKRPNGDSREVIELFERALTMNPRDGGVYQAYALYVAKLGDVDGARKILKRGTELDKRHPPLWQAWGVLESRNGSAAVARDIFQQGIWACAQSSGGQSGGRHCARLWQAWGVLEARENDPAAARRCFNRALDADSRNVAAVIAWTLMEQDLGNYKDARLIFERALKQFSSPSDEKMSLWRAYEVMETKAGNVNAAQQVYQRSIKDAILRDDYLIRDKTLSLSSSNTTFINNDKVSEVEVVTWKSRTDSGFGGNEVWMADDGYILGKVPSSTMLKKRYK